MPLSKVPQLFPADYMGKGTSGILHVKLVPTDVRTFYNKNGNLLIYLLVFGPHKLIYVTRVAPGGEGGDP